MRRLSVSVFLLCLAARATCLAETPSLLASAIGRWSAERDRWAFTEIVREYDGDKVRQERVEHFDPSQPDENRWTLLKVDGRAPTAAEVSEFRARKGARRKHNARSPADFVDFGGVTVDGENEHAVRYSVPLRSDISRLVPTEKFVIEVTVDKHTSSIEHVSVGLRAPVRIALGLARVSNVNFEIDFARIDAALPPDPAYTKPEGKATATLVKFGTRSDFEWTDFRRVK